MDGVRLELGRLTIAGSAQVSQETLLTDFLEQEVLAHFDYIHVARQASTERLNVHAKRIRLDWPSLKTGLRALAFDPDSACSWTRLGVAKYEGPPPSLEQIERRARLAGLLSSASQGSAWTSLDREAAQRFHHDAEAARLLCVESLSEVLKMRRRSNGWKLPRWQEPSPDCTNLLRGRFKPLEIIGRSHCTCRTSKA